ncbi:Uncharacterised protein [Mycobacterium tuberculosis]|uniref:Uncharacterized protein n=1 Tax=Mycobacterium tuberculosis TaxID=1773 RepID=A0A0T7LJR7_MYCTX|nr:Uncharacterised protein [Mycobacterium tuberculosis]CNM52779.1 Uncharacterised protein [Mycobacterium tuberculosis]CNM86044.1 Uncharacterised protein [Mycobacterium tuberculosis]CNN29581.1 Uncharacterised protein [Mycobacterium tuberculosis]COV65122.1 Uncharacterised protein [Mycobacterium tuberculosis]
MVGQRQGTQAQPGGLLDQLLGRAGPVEEAVRRMRMQLGIRDGRSDPFPARRLVRPALAGPWDVPIRVERRHPGMARLAVKHPFHFRPARRPVAPPHIPQYIEQLFDTAQLFSTSSPAKHVLNRLGLLLPVRSGGHLYLGSQNDGGDLSWHN